MQSEEPTWGLTCRGIPLKDRSALRNAGIGGACLSSTLPQGVGLRFATIATLVLSCHLQVWNPEQAISDISRRKVMMMSSHRAPYALGDTRVTMARPKGRDLARVS
ncbi:hypothetical protein AB3S75_003056 [Citrus x aurantiifolia]